MSAAAVILAAGASMRLGRPKQLLELGGEAMVRRTARLCLEAGFDPVLAVLGSSAADIAAVLDGLCVTCVVNPEWPSGMASSIRAGLAAVPDQSSAALLLPCDQPALEVDVLHRFRRRHQDSPAATLASAYGRGGGIPALFPRARFPELDALRGDKGAKGFLASAEWLPFPGGEIDFDTEADVEAWLKR
jgi:molybdenum cofactor cytidylyltransferase